MRVIGADTSRREQNQDALDTPVLGGSEFKLAGYPERIEKSK